jgi:hypothetical protein
MENEKSNQPFKDYWSAQVSVDVYATIGFFFPLTLSSDLFSSGGLRAQTYSKGPTIPRPTTH